MPTPWIAWKKILLSCNHVTSSSSSSVYDPCLISPTHTSNHHPYLLHGKNPKKGSNGSHHSCCNSLKCVVHGNTRVAHRGEEDELGGEVVVVEGEEVDEEIESLLSPQHHHQQHHQYMQLPQCPTLHSVSELRVGDSARSIVEIIFRSSWYETGNNNTCNVGLGPDGAPGVKPEAIFKVHNHPTVVARFEEYRAMVKGKALLQSHHHHHHHSSSSSNSSSKTSSSKKNSRCLVDGNELLRFYCTTTSCNMGKTPYGTYVSTTSSSSSSSSSSTPAPSSSSSTSTSSSSCTHMSLSPSLCMLPSCGVCHILRHGFPARGHPGIHTSASSRGAHDAAVSHGFSGGGGGHISNESNENIARKDGKVTKLAMIVCRVIAGRVKKMGHVEDNEDDETEKNIVSYDSVSGNQSNPNLEELLVFNARAVLPCFMVIYSTTLC